MNLLAAIAFPQADSLMGVPLHIPDGFLSTGIAAFCWLLAIIFVGISVWQTNRTLEERTVPMMGVLAAFIFAGQMMNFPIAGGTSGHLLGGCLAAILVGPWAAILVMAMVIGVQGVIFQDGGLAALGANILNMGVITSLVGFAMYRGTAVITGHNRAASIAAAFIAAWVTVMAAAFATSAELALSGTSDWDVVLPAMMGTHALIGVGEALITAGVVAFVLATRPDLLRTPPEQPDYLRLEGATS